MTLTAMKDEGDPVAKELLQELGDISGVEIFHNQVMVVVYKRPEKTKSGLYIAPQTQREDAIQGHIGLVVKKGPSAFVPSDGWSFSDTDVGDWIFFRPSDGWGLKIRNTTCRVLTDTSVKGRVSHPDHVW